MAADPDLPSRCEDFPCCGHTDGLPCNWRPNSLDGNPHAFCFHEEGECSVSPGYFDEDEDEDEDK